MNTVAIVVSSFEALQNPILLDFIEQNKQNILWYLPAVHHLHVLLVGLLDSLPQFADLLVLFIHYGLQSVCLLLAVCQGCLVLLLQLAALLMVLAARRQQLLPEEKGLWPGACPRGRIPTVGLLGVRVRTSELSLEVLDFRSPQGKLLLQKHHPALLFNRRLLMRRRNKRSVIEILRVFNVIAISRKMSSAELN